MALIRWAGRPWVDFAFKVIAIAALVAGAWNYVDNARLTQCQARYAESANESTAARSDAAAEDRRALDDLVAAFATDPGSGRAALMRYQRVRAAADARRAANPVPPPPSTRCG